MEHLSCARHSAKHKRYSGEQRAVAPVLMERAPVRPCHLQLNSCDWQTHGPKSVHVLMEGGHELRKAGSL